MRGVGKAKVVEADTVSDGKIYYSEIYDRASMKLYRTLLVF